MAAPKRSRPFSIIRVDFHFQALPTAMPDVQAGKLKILALSSVRRSPAVPNVPTVEESGIKDFDVTLWAGIFAPSGTPSEIVTRLNSEIDRVLAQPEVKESLKRAGAELIPTRRLGDSRDSRIGSGVIQDGKRRVFAMGQAVPVRTDYTAGEVRRFARRAKDGAQARRLLALAAVLDGASREEAAKIGGMDRQTLRDWVIRYNEQGPDGLINIPSPGAPPKLDDTQKAFLRRIVEEGPIPAIHGVVRWRACDLIMRLHDEFGLSVSDDTIYRALKDLGFSHVSARPKAYKQDADAMAAFKKTLPYAWRKSARHSRLARQ